MRLILAVAVVLAPITVTDKCGNVDEEKTCRRICEVKLGKRIYHSEVVGKSGNDLHRTCACYPERILVTDEGDGKPPKPERER
jgi:hypothetical protein